MKTLSSKLGWMFENQQAIRGRFAVVVLAFCCGVLLAAAHAWIVLGVSLLPIIFAFWASLDTAYMQGQLVEMEKNINERRGVLESLVKMREAIDTIHLPPADRYH